MIEVELMARGSSNCSPAGHTNWGVGCLKKQNATRLRWIRFDRQAPTMDLLFVTGGVGCEQPSAGIGTQVLDSAGCHPKCCGEFPALMVE